MTSFFRCWSHLFVPRQIQNFPKFIFSVIFIQKNLHFSTSRLFRVSQRNRAVANCSWKFDDATGERADLDTSSDDSTVFNLCQLASTFFCHLLFLLMGKVFDPGTDFRGKKRSLVSTTCLQKTGSETGFSAQNPDTLLDRIFLGDVFSTGKQNRVWQDMRQVFKQNRVCLGALSRLKDCHRFCFLSLNPVLLSCLKFVLEKTLSSNLSRI